MRIDQMKYFVQIVESRSFRKAAQVLAITQPALTVAIRAMEEELDLVLLTRDRKGVVLTSMGKKVYDDCQRILQTIESSTASWKALSTSDSEIGVVRIVAIPAFCTILAVSLWPEFHRRFPRIDLLPYTGHYDCFHESLRDGRANIGFSALFLDGEERAAARFSSLGYECVPLLEDEFAILLSREHPLAGNKVLTREHVAQLSFCLYTATYENPSLVMIVNSLMAIAGLSKFSAVYASDKDTIFNMILQNGHADILLKHSLEQEWLVRRGFLVTRLVAGVRILPSRYYMFHLPSRLLSGPERRFVDFVKEYYGDS